MVAEVRSGDCSTHRLIPVACKKHWLCLDCVYPLVDEAGKGTLQPEGKDPNNIFWRCTHCRHIHPVLVDRASIIRNDEFDYWRHKIAKHRLNELNANWPTLLFSAKIDGWCAPLSPQMDGVRADGQDVVEARVVHVRVKEAVQFMDSVPMFIARLLHWGYSLDNSVKTAEGDALKAFLIEELRTLAASKRKVHTDELKEHLLEVGRNAHKPVVVAEKGERLGNPIDPPGYKAYRDFLLLRAGATWAIRRSCCCENLSYGRNRWLVNRVLSAASHSRSIDNSYINFSVQHLCEWTAKACFLSPSGRREVVQFMERMKTEKAKGW